MEIVVNDKKLFIFKKILENMSENQTFFNYSVFIVARQDYLRKRRLTN